MKIGQRILQLLHPHAEADRMRYREAVVRAAAEAEDLTRTLSMSSDDFRRMMEEEHDRELRSVVQFDTFAAICEHRYSPPESVMRLCKHRDHEAHSTGLAACKQGQCPKLKEAARK